MDALDEGPSKILAIQTDMKVQNRSARIWIGLGLLGLIVFAVRSVVGPVGGIVGEMFSGTAVIFLLVGWYVESRSKKKQSDKVG